jgi:TonB-dependent starch-binding outer membrane protein SusC
MTKKAGWPFFTKGMYKTFALIKLTILMLAVASQANGKQNFQENVSLSERNAPLIRVFKQIKKQTGYSYLVPATLLGQANKVSIDVKNVALTDALDIIFKDQPLGYSIVGKTIVVKEKEVKKTVSYDVSAPVDEVKGRVTDPNGEPIVGANVVVKGTNIAAITDRNGEFSLSNVPEGARIEISFVGYEPQIVSVKNRTPINTSLAIAAKELDVAIVQGYGMTSHRTKTGSISKITSDQIAKQPISNPLSALQGRVSGVFITTQNGLPGGNIKVQIRGQNSISAGINPLYIVDGVPFLATPLNEGLANYRGANGDISPLNSLNPSDIESIEILKDADATAIYGSRGSNGVILITTKQGKAGKTNVSFNIYNGINTSYSNSEYLSLQEYLSLRREAFKNDGVIPTASNAPELMLWDTTKSINWRDYILGNHSTLTSVQTDISGGNNTTKFLVGFNYRKEGSIIKGDFDYKRFSSHLKVEHNAFDNRLSLNLSVTYSADVNRLPKISIPGLLTLPPNYPVFDTSGKYNWNLSVNPAAQLMQKSRSRTDNIIANIIMKYRIANGLSFKSSFGYTKIQMNQVLTQPLASLNPNSTSSVSTAYYGNNGSVTLIAEPQLDYSILAKSYKLNLLVGSTFQKSTRDGFLITGTNFSSDALLENMGSAGLLSGGSTIFSEYKYNSLFGRLNFILTDKYIINVVYRRDGSSRFGPRKEFGSFGSLGLAWIFTNEQFIRSRNFISFGKFRASYGLVGNDQIQDYGYLSSYTSSGTYQGFGTFRPSRIANPFYGWEVNKKLELGLDIGFFNDKVLLTGAWYRNVSDNLLVDYPLPGQTGFTDYQANLPATVLNSGFELDLNSTIIKCKNFSWSSSLNVSFPRNRLMDYPGLEQSSNANTYVIGKDLSVYKGYRFTGVDPFTGFATFEDINKDGTISFPNDVVVLGKTSPDFFGGISNTIIFKDFQLDLLGQFVKQYANLGTISPGRTRSNQFKIVLDRWQNPGDVTDIPIASTTPGKPAYIANSFLNSSNYVFRNSSYLRLKTLSLSYRFKETVCKRLGFSSFSLNAQAFNVLTFTPSKTEDPESQLGGIAPLKSYAFGLNLKL